VHNQAIPGYVCRSSAGHKVTVPIQEQSFLKFSFEHSRHYKFRGNVCRKPVIDKCVQAAGVGMAQQQTAAVSAVIRSWNTVSVKSAM